MPSSSALLFIPDISGFTQFVQKTEVSHSRHIIAELLEVLIDANEIGLTLAEIEGDALFYYLENEIPAREMIFQQIEKMFIRFHSHLLAYKYKRICQCGACTSAEELKLKFVVHTGEIDFITVKDSSKPFGPNVVLAHRLLKNSIPKDEYALFSSSSDSQLTSNPDLPFKIQEQSSRGEEQYDLGKVEYTYYDLTSLMDFVESTPASAPGEKVKRPWRFSMQVQAPVEELYDVISNFDRRLEWSKGVSDINYEKDRVNQVGTEHKCVVNDKLISFETITSDFDGKLVYGERTSDVPIVDEMNTYFILEPENIDETKLTIEVHPYTASILKKALVPLIKKLVWKNFKEQFKVIKTVAEQNISDI